MSANGKLAPRSAELIALFAQAGGLTKLARAIGVSADAVMHWREGVPRQHAGAVAEALSISLDAVPITQWGRRDRSDEMRRVLEAAGGPVALGKVLGISQGTIGQWRVVPPWYVHPVSRLTGIPAAQLPTYQVGSGVGLAWTPEVIAEVRRLWDAGVTTVEIGRRFGVSKNVIISKKRRLGFPSRPSPIGKRADGERWSRKPKRAMALPDLPAEKPRPAPVKPTFGAPAKQIRTVYRPIADRACSFLVPTPGHRHGLYCDAPVTRGSYCEEHAAICYARTTAPQQEAA